MSTAELQPETMLRVEMDGEELDGQVDQSPEPVQSPEPTEPQPGSNQEQDAASKLADDEFESRVQFEERCICDLTLSIEEIKLRLKIAKEELQEHIKALSRLKLSGPEFLPLIDRNEAQRIAADGHPGDLPAGEPATSADLSPCGDWRAASIVLLGLKRGTQEKLIEAGIETVGQLEGKRAEFEWFKAIPGIGRGKADQIEESVLNWLTRNRDSEVFCQQVTAAPKQVQSDEDRETAELESVIGELKDKSSDDLQPSKNGSKEWQSGWDAAEAGSNLSDCPYTNPQYRSDWVKGWILFDRSQSDDASEPRQEDDLSAVAATDHDDLAADDQSGLY